MTDAKVKVQPFHKRSYLGNDCHTYFEEKVYKTCTQHIMDTVNDLTTNPWTIQLAKENKDELDKINDKYRDVHIKISHGRQINESDITEIRNLIKSYMQSYREIYKGKCLPKHHFLEAHCADFINEWGFGMAKLGESGIELAHQTMAHAEKCARHLGTRRLF